MSEDLGKEYKSIPAEILIEAVIKSGIIDVHIKEVDDFGGILTAQKMICDWWSDVTIFK